MAPNLDQVREKAAGKWPDILTHFGVPAEFLVVSKSKEGPCPCCGGNTRYRFDDRHGNGDWFCSHCGGKDRQGGGGNGFDLIMRMQNWTLAETVRAVAKHLGVEDTWQSPTPFNPGRCDGFWQYTDEFVVVRRNRDTFNSKGKREKDVRPWRWNGQRWECKRPDGPLPLYNRDELRRRPDAPVLVVEGEKTADAAIRLFPELVVTTWHGGTDNVATADWSLLRGREVFLWPDADADGKGLNAMKKLATLAPAETFWLVTPPEDIADGWDLADALKEGWTPEQAQKWLEGRWEILEPDTTASVTKTAAEGQQEQPQEPVTFEERWAAYEAFVDEVVGRGWPIMKAKAAISDRAGQLSIPRPTASDLEQLLEESGRRRRPAAVPISPGGIFPVRDTPWATQGIFRHGVNLLSGQSGAGKSRLAADCMASWLRADRTWLGRELYGPPVTERHALIIGTDQPMEDWFETLSPVGLCLRRGDGNAQLHERVTLYHLEYGLRLDTDGLATIRRWADQHPGSMILVDSLAAVLPPGVDEDKPAAGRVVHSLAEAAGNCWTILTHHNRKSAGREGDVGVNATRGSSSISAAASRFISLSLIQQPEYGQNVAQENDPRRRLFSTKRAGAPVDVIIASDENGHWSEIETAAEFRRAQRQEQLRKALPEKQLEVQVFLEEHPGEWFTVKALAKGLGSDWDDGEGQKGSKAAGLRQALRKLVEKGLVELAPSANGQTYRALKQP